MIKLSETRGALLNLHNTIAALETLKTLKAYYDEPKPGPAYVTFRPSMIEVQIDREIMVECLNGQIERLEKYLATLGIDAKG